MLYLPSDERKKYSNKLHLKLHLQLSLPMRNISEFLTKTMSAMKIRTTTNPEPQKLQNTRWSKSDCSNFQLKSVLARRELYIFSPFLSPYIEISSLYSYPSILLFGLSLQAAQWPPACQFSMQVCIGDIPSFDNETISGGYGQKYANELVWSNWSIQTFWAVVEFGLLKIASDNATRLVKKSLIFVVKWPTTENLGERDRVKVFAARNEGPSPVVFQSLELLINCLTAELVLHCLCKVCRETRIS